MVYLSFHARGRVVTEFPPVMWSVIPALIFLVLASVAQAQSRLTPVDGQSLAAALQAEDQGNFHDAELILTALIGKHPNNFQIAASLGEVYEEEGKFEQASVVLEKACQLDPSSATALANLGAAYLKLNRNDDAVRALKRAERLDSRNSDTQSNLGIALMQAGQAREAANAFAAAASSRPADDDLLYNWALALYDSGQSGEANKVLLRASNAESSASVQSLLGDISEARKQYQEAVAHYQAAVKINPSEPNLYMLGVEFLRHWTFDAAIQNFEYGTGKYPNSKRMLLALGVARYSNNDYAGAAPIFAQILDANPDDEFVANLLGHNCSLMPDDSPGCAKLISFAERHPSNAPVATYAAAGILHRPGGQQDLALAGQLLQQAISADEKFPESYYQLGILNQQEGNWQASIDPLERAITLKPDYSQAHYRLALAYSHTNQREKVQTELALRQKYSQQEKDDLNARFKQVTMFLLAQR